MALVIADMGLVRRKTMHFRFSYSKKPLFFAEKDGAPRLQQIRQMQASILNIL
ncbi:MAG: hypothetical protein ACLQIQ_15675 [Beijerinckiaceae bacterium]